MKKNEKGFALIEIMIVFGVVLIVILVGWQILINNRQPKTVDEVLSNLRHDAAQTYSNGIFTDADSWRAQGAATSFIKVAGYDYAVSSPGKSIRLDYQYDDKGKITKKYIFFSKEIPPANSTNVIKEFVNNKLQDYGFKSVDNETYQLDKITCKVLNDKLEFYANIMHDGADRTGTIEVNCFNNDNLQGYALSLKPFVDAYFSEGNQDKGPSDMTFGPVVIKSQNGNGVITASKNKGYDIAEMVVAADKFKMIALFYKKDRTWHYITQANDEFGFECSAIKNSPDARKALYDQICLGDNGQVRLDTNNRALQ